MPLAALQKFATIGSGYCTKGKGVSVAGRMNNWVSVWQVGHRPIPRRFLDLLRHADDLPLVTAKSRAAHHGEFQKGENMLKLALAVSMTLVLTPCHVKAQSNLNFAGVQTAKQRCINTCRARYRACLSLKQIPPSECRAVSRDCAHFTCNAR